MIKSERTEYQYKKMFDKISKDVDIMKCKFSDIENYFEKNKYSISTQGSYLSAIVCYLEKEEHDDVVSDYIVKLRNSITNIKNELKDKSLKKQLSDKEMQSFVSWNTLLKIFNKFGAYVNDMNVTEATILLDYTMLALYVKNPPRRILDYSNMWYIEKYDGNFTNNVIDLNKINDATYVNTFDWTIVEDDEDDFDDDNDDDIVTKIEKKNYYVKKNDNGYFIFGDYKTKKKYNIQILQITPDLVDILDKYIKFFSIKYDTRMFSARNKYEKVSPTFLKTNYFVERLKTIFMLTIGKNISASALRHIYIKDIYDKKSSSFKKAIVARCMAHTFEEQF
jgi:hypothetical protein